MLMRSYVRITRKTIFRRGKTTKEKYDMKVKTVILFTEFRCTKEVKRKVFAFFGSKSLLERDDVMIVYRTIISTVKFIKRDVYKILIAITHMLRIERKSSKTDSDIVTTISFNKTFIVVEHPNKPLVIQQPLTAITIATPNRIKSREYVTINKALNILSTNLSFGDKGLEWRNSARSLK